MKRAEWHDNSAVFAKKNCSCNGHEACLCFSLPADLDLESYVESRARTKASEIVNRTANTMHLENQELPENTIKEAFERRVSAIIQEMPKSLWDYS